MYNYLIDLDTSVAVRFAAENESFNSFSDNKSSDNVVRSHTGVLNATNVDRNYTQWRSLLNTTLFHVSYKFLC